MGRIESLDQNSPTPDNAPSNGGENTREHIPRWYPLIPKRYQGHGEWPHRYATVNGIPLREDVSQYGAGFEWGLTPSYLYS